MPLALLSERITAYHHAILANAHHRYRSWEHCYRFFRARTREQLLADKESAALQLGMYLASWGMFRGSGFLLQHAYTIHIRTVEFLALDQFEPLWNSEFGAGANDAQFVPLVDNLATTVTAAYIDYGNPSDTLVTKVILGTLGCLPARDRLFKAGFKASGYTIGGLNTKFVSCTLRVCRENLKGLLQEQQRIEATEGMRYPVMKLLDMYFWQVGFEADDSSRDPSMEIEG